MTQTEILVRSTLDGSMQPSLFYRSPLPGKRPLLIGLHTWSHNRFNQINNFLPYAEKLGFHLLLPEFRGPNLTGNPHCTEACVSDYALQDVKDAVDSLLPSGNIDEDGILLLGHSGGGLMALMLAAKWPELFRAVGAYVPITDLAVWADENANYREHVLACCSGSKEEMAKRSPIYHLAEISRANVKLFHGKHDPTVPVSHSIRFFSRMTEEYPSARVFLDVFDGGHEIDMDQAMYWLLSQYDKRALTQVTG
ncbi:MAG: alpha/beta fold hydrolase [Clostridia bacterium]|nr:alpha/beta fold hydrolase [Clostridia bacterium]